MPEQKSNEKDHNTDIKIDNTSDLDGKIAPESPLKPEQIGKKDDNHDEDFFFDDNNSVSDHQTPNQNEAIEQKKENNFGLTPERVEEIQKRLNDWSNKNVEDQIEKVDEKRPTREFDDLFFDDEDLKQKNEDKKSDEDIQKSDLICSEDKKDSHAKEIVFDINSNKKNEHKEDQDNINKLDSNVENKVQNIIQTNSNLNNLITMPDDEFDDFFNSFPERKINSDSNKNIENENSQKNNDFIDEKKLIRDKNIIEDINQANKGTKLAETNKNEKFLNAEKEEIEQKDERDNNSQNKG